MADGTGGGRLVALLGLALFLGGCAGRSATDSRDAPPVPSGMEGSQAGPAPGAGPRADAGEPQRHESGRAHIYATFDLAMCPLDNEILVERHHEYVPLERRDGDRSLAIHLEWQPVNPTAEHLRLFVRDRDDPGGTVWHDQWGPSPQDLVLLQDDLQRLNRTTWLEVGIDGCAPEQPVAVHSVGPDNPQAVDWRLDWNTVDAR